MSNIESLAVTPERPTISVYGVGALWLFELFTRDSYFERFGEQAPPFDPAQPVQPWCDTDTSVDVKQYSVFDPDGPDSTFERFAIPRERRRRPNLPGFYDYPVFVPEPTNAVQEFPDGREEPISPARLTTPEEASVLCDEIGGSHISLGHLPMFPYYYPPGELRRIHIVHYNANGVDYRVPAWLLRSLQTKRGVGHPGYWNLSDPTNLCWVDDDQPQPSLDHPSIGVPCRELYEDEEVYLHLGGLWRFRKIVVPAPVFTEDNRVAIQTNSECVDDLLGDVETVEAHVKALNTRMVKLESRVSGLETVLD